MPKGPSAAIGGVADFGGRGGVVNVVRKKAEPDHKTQVTQTLSTQDNGTLYLTGDLGGTLLNGTLWRVVGYGSGTGGRSEGGYAGGQGSAGVLGSLGWRLSPARRARTGW